METELLFQRIRQAMIIDNIDRLEGKRDIESYRVELSNINHNIDKIIT